MGMQGQLGNFFGQVLVLLNLGFVEELTERELDEIVCGASSETTSIDQLRKATNTLLDLPRSKQDTRCTRGE